MMGGIKVLCNLQNEKIWVAVLQNTRIKNTFTKNYHLPGIEGRANILFEYSIYIYIFIFGYGFCGSFSMLFPEGSGSCDKEILRNFLLHSTSISMSSKGLSQIFKIFFQTGYVNIFVLRGVVFSRYVQLKRSFSAEKKHQPWNLIHTSVQKPSNFNAAMY